MEKTKSNNSLFVIILILVAIVCMLTGFILGKGLFLTPNNNEENNNGENVNKEEEKIVTISEIERQSLMEKIEVYNQRFVKDYSLNGIINASNVTKLYFLVSNLEGFYDGYNKNYFTVNDLKNVARKYFKDDIQVEYGDILVPGYEDIVLYELGNNGKYTYSAPGIGGPSWYSMDEYYVDGYYNQTKDVYTINAKLLYNNLCDDICTRHDKYYSDVTLNNVVYEDNSTYGMEIIDVYNVIKDKLPVTSYTFVKNSSGNYVLDSVVVK